MKTYYIGSEQSPVELAAKLGVELVIIRELTIDETKSWEDRHEDLLSELYQSDNEGVYSVDEITANNKLGYLVTTQVHHPYPLKGVKETDSHLYPDCADKFWRELKYYIVIP